MSVPTREQVAESARLELERIEREGLFDTPQSIRERLARALFSRSVAAHEGDQWTDKTAQVKECYLGDVDTILAELESPSEGMIEACIQAAEKQWVAFDEFSPPLFFKPIIVAMIQHIREGGS